MIDDLVVALVDAIHADNGEHRHDQEPEEYADGKEAELLLDRQVDKSDQPHQATGQVVLA